MSMATSAIIATAAIAGAGAGSQIYATRSAGKQNRRAQDLQERDSQRALEDAAADRALAAEEARAQRELEARRLTEAQDRWTQAQARDQSRWQDYLRANEPHWTAGGRILGSLYDMAGMSGGGQAMPNVQALAAASPDARRAAAPGPGPYSPPREATVDGIAPGGPVSTTPLMPRGVPARTRMAPRPYAMAARPSGGGMSTQQLLSLVELANRGSGGGTITPTDPMYQY